MSFKVNKWYITSYRWSAKPVLASIDSKDDKAYIEIQSIVKI